MPFKIVRHPLFLTWAQGRARLRYPLRWPALMQLSWPLMSVQRRLMWHGATRASLVRRSAFRKGTGTMPFRPMRILMSLCQIHRILPCATVISRRAMYVLNPLVHYQTAPTAWAHYVLSFLIHRPVYG